MEVSKMKESGWKSAGSCWPSAMSRVSHVPGGPGSGPPPPPRFWCCRVRNRKVLFTRNELSPSALPLTHVTDSDSPAAAGVWGHSIHMWEAPPPTQFNSIRTNPPEGGGPVMAEEEDRRSSLFTEMYKSRNQLRPPGLDFTLARPGAVVWYEPSPAGVGLSRAHLTGVTPRTPHRGAAQGFGAHDARQLALTHLVVHGGKARTGPVICRQKPDLLLITEGKTLFWETVQRLDQKLYHENKVFVFKSKDTYLWG